jgi:late competence protein required for DNA uptake (superfamily II DNA/RNA helicase)
MGIDIIKESGKLRCSECNNKFIRLKFIESTGEQLCESCLERKGGFEYMGIIKELDEEFPGVK